MSSPITLDMTCETVDEEEDVSICVREELEPVQRQEFERRQASFNNYKRTLEEYQNKGYSIIDAKSKEPPPVTTETKQAMATAQVNRPSNLKPSNLKPSNLKKPSIMQKPSNIKPAVIRPASVSIASQVAQSIKVTPPSTNNVVAKAATTSAPQLTPGSNLVMTPTMSAQAAAPVSAAQKVPSVLRLAPPTTNAGNASKSNVLVLPPNVAQLGNAPIKAVVLPNAAQMGNQPLYIRIPGPVNTTGTATVPVNLTGLSNAAVIRLPAATTLSSSTVPIAPKPSTVSGIVPKLTAPSTGTMPSAASLLNPSQLQSSFPEPLIPKRGRPPLRSYSSTVTIPSFDPKTILKHPAIVPKPAPLPNYNLESELESLLRKQQLQQPSTSYAVKNYGRPAQAVKIYVDEYYYSNVVLKERPKYNGTLLTAGIQCHICPEKNLFDNVAITKHLLESHIRSKPTLRQSRMGPAETECPNCLRVIKKDQAQTHADLVSDVPIRLRS